MKKIFLFLVLLIPVALHAQKKAKMDSVQVIRNSILIANVRLLEQIEIDLSVKNRFKLYQTEDMNTLLELDTKTGIVRQIHWALKSDEEDVYSINANDLSNGNDLGPNVFELYATKNMYQFILINKVNGTKWHIQWGDDKDHRWIRKIKQQ